MSKTATISVTRRSGLKIAWVVLWTTIRAYLDGSLTITFYMGEDVPEILA